jgi:hypothetical protein
VCGFAVRLKACHAASSFDTTQPCAPYMWEYCGRGLKKTRLSWVPKGSILLVNRAAEARGDRRDGFAVRLKACHAASSFDTTQPCATYMWEYCDRVLKKTSLSWVPKGSILLVTRAAETRGDRRDGFAVRLKACHAASSFDTTQPCAPYMWEYCDRGCLKKTRLSWVPKGSILLVTRAAETRGDRRDGFAVRLKACHAASSFDTTQPCATYMWEYCDRVLKKTRLSWVPKGSILLVTSFVTSGCSFFFHA